MQVELVCRNEEVVVAVVEAQVLDVSGIISGSRDKDPGRFPLNTDIAHMEIMKCRRCKGRLWFKGADEELYLARPGELKAVQ